MKRPSRRLTYLTWGVTLPVLGALLILSFQEPRGPLRRLPDGTNLELRQVTFGRQHRYVEGHLWQRLWATTEPLLTGKDTSGLTMQTPDAEPVLWLRQSPPALPDALPVNLRANGVTLDEHGCMLPARDWFDLRQLLYIGTGGTNRPDPLLTDVAISIYPRRSGRFRFAFLNQLEPRARVVAEYDVAVPPAGPFPEWHAPRPPVTVRSRGVEFTLWRLRERAGDFGIEEPQASFRYREQGRSTTNWRPEELVVSDATGNTLTNFGDDDPQNVTFFGLCRREPAWKLRVRFVRPFPAQAPAAFVWKVPPVEVPGLTRLELPPFHARHGAVALRLNEVVVGGSSGLSGVMLHAAALDSRFSVALIRATDQRGRVLPIPPGAYQTLREGEADYQFEFPYPRSTRKLRLTFGLYETHTVEFLVKP